MLPLARWNNHHGCSAGRWLVRGAPGVCVLRQSNGLWKIVTLLRLPPPPSLSHLHEIWPEADIAASTSSLQQSDLLGRRFATRQQLLAALDQHLTTPASPALADALEEQ